MDLRRLDSIVQFLSATNTQLESWDTVIPYNVMLYCPETRQIKLGENKKWAETPVFIDFNIIDNLNILIQSILPEINDLNEYTVTNTVSILNIQNRIQKFLNYFDKFIEDFNITFDSNEKNEITNIGLRDEIDDIKTSIITLDNENEADHLMFKQINNQLNIKIEDNKSNIIILNNKVNSNIEDIGLINSVLVGNNLIINGGFQIWDDTYMEVEANNYEDSGIPVLFALNGDTFTVLPSYSFRFGFPSFKFGSSALTTLEFTYRMEYKLAKFLSNQYVNFSFYKYFEQSPDVFQIEFRVPTSTNDFSSTTVIQTWNFYTDHENIQWFNKSCKLPDCSKGLEIKMKFNNNGSNNPFTAYIWDLGLTLGKKYVPIINRPFELENMLCKRYYERIHYKSGQIVTFARRLNDNGTDTTYYKGKINYARKIKTPTITVSGDYGINYGDSEDYSHLFFDQFNIVTQEQADLIFRFNNGILNEEIVDIVGHNLSTSEIIIDSRL